MCFFAGQDAASVVESSWAQLTVEYDGAKAQELSFSMFLPSVLVRSVRGGTVYATQRVGLEMIGCAGPGRKWALAERLLHLRSRPMSVLLPPLQAIPKHRVTTSWQEDRNCEVCPTTACSSLIGADEEDYVQF